MLISKVTPKIDNTCRKPQKHFNQNVLYVSSAQNDISFSGGKSKFFEPIKKFFKPVTDLYKKAMDSATDKMAKWIGKILGNETVEKFIDKTKDRNLVSHLSAFTSIVLSSFYIKKTLENPKLDTEKKRTLAINQGAVAIVSAICAYTIDIFTDEKIKKFIDKFKKLNHGDKNLSKYENGIKSAKKIMIFGTLYRFIAPVLVTPLANHIGNKYNEKKTAEAKVVKQA